MTQPSVTRQQVRVSNSRIDADSYPRTAVFVGGTAGIGEAALQELVLAGKGKWSARIYVVGRQESAARVKESLDNLRAQNPDVDLIWTAGEVSLLAEVKRICTELKEKEKSLDLLFLSTGYAPLGGLESTSDIYSSFLYHALSPLVRYTFTNQGEGTSEGLVVSQSLGHYSRILFIQHLLPLLKASKTQGRVVAVLAGGMESTWINVDDLNLEKPGNYGVIRCHAHTRSMLSMAMEQLAEDNKNVTFIHAHPGLVNTGNLNRGWLGRWFLQLLANIVLAPFFLLMGFTIEESRERTLYLMTSAKYGGHGVPLDEPVLPGLTTRGEETGGLFLVNQRGASVVNDKVLTELRNGARGPIWAKTTEVLQPYL